MRYMKNIKEMHLDDKFIRTQGYDEDSALVSAAKHWTVV